MLSLLKQTDKIMITILSILALALLYFMPSIVGSHKKNAGAILILNIFLGWTFLGWIIALIWASTKD